MKTIPQVKSKKDITTLEKRGVIIEFEPLNEPTTPDIVGYEQEEWNKLEKKFDRIGLCAWFCAHVTVKIKDFDADDYLGCCSYNSFEDFTKIGKGQYYSSMINQCIDQVNKDIVIHNEEIKKNWNIRRAKNMIKPYGLTIIDLKKVVC